MKKFTIKFYVNDSVQENIPWHAPFFTYKLDDHCNESSFFGCKQLITSPPRQ
jgi:hypothetical protein